VPERQATSQEGRENDLLKQSIGVVLEKPSGKTGDIQQTSPAATLPSPRGAHLRAQERRERQAVTLPPASFLAIALTVSAI